MKNSEPTTVVWPGRAYPSGANREGSGVNFALFSPHADKVELCIFDATGGQERQCISICECTDRHDDISLGLPDADGAPWQVLVDTATDTEALQADALTVQVMAETPCRLQCRSLNLLSRTMVSP